MSDDKDSGKTVIRPMPGAGGGGAPSGGGQKTVIGGDPFGGAPGQGGFGGPPAQGGFGGAPQGGFGSAPQGGFGGDQGFGPQGGFAGGQDQGFGSFGGDEVGQTGAWAGATPTDQGFFPEMQGQPAPSFQATPGRKISLDAALSARITGHSSEVNPITAAASGLLILFGRLRSQVVDMNAVPLMQHVTQEIEAFEARVLQAGVDPTDAQIAKYCLCGTADDIVQNLPGTDRSVWLQYSMVARFFNVRTSGKGFFQEVDKALQNPAQKYHLLELMLTCLQLGFEGQYRAMQGGDVQLQQVKRGIFEALRRVKPRGDDDISPRWQGVALAARRNSGGVPIWVVAIVAGTVMAGAYFGMRMLLTDEGTALADRMVSLHPTAEITLQRASTVPEPPPSFGAPPPPPPPQVVRVDEQLDRIRSALDGQAVTVTRSKDFIILELNNAVLFASGSADVRSEFTPLAAEIAQVLQTEPGPIRVIGHTDNIPLSGRGRFKDNYELSVARAESVANKLREGITDASRLVVEGKGDLEPIADNGTSEGRAQNRRVEIMLKRQESL